MSGSAGADAQGLARLEERLREDLERLCLPAEDWLRRSAEDPLDVVIVGAGMSGLAAAAALRFAGVDRVRLFDASAPGQEGPWVTHARMETLRSPKNLVGPALGQPSLTFRAWYEAQYGKAGWEALDRIPRVLWQDYLNWFRVVLDLPVEHSTKVERIDGETSASDSPLVVLETLGTRSGIRQTLRARHVVLATGMDALGGPRVPALAHSLPRNRWNHNTDAIDFEALRGRRLAVFGGGDSALDVAATALEHGVGSVDIFTRAQGYGRINYWKAFTHPGHAHGFANLPVEQRLKLLRFLKAQKTPPARGTIQRVARFDNVRLHVGSVVDNLSVTPSGPIEVTSSRGSFEADHLVFATGYSFAPELRVELAGIVPYLAYWGGTDAGEWEGLGFPRLADDYSFIEKNTGERPSLRRVHLFTGAALLSHGKLTGDIPGISAGAERLARGIVSRLYADDVEAQLAQIQAYAEPEVEPEAWAKLVRD